MNEEIPIVESNETGLQLEVNVKATTLKEALLKAFIKATKLVKDVVPEPFFIPTLVAEKGTAAIRIEKDVRIWSVRMQVCKAPKAETESEKKLTYLAMRSVV